MEEIYYIDGNYWNWSRVSGRGINSFYSIIEKMYKESLCIFVCKDDSYYVLFMCKWVNYKLKNNMFEIIVWNNLYIVDVDFFVIGV